MMDVRNLPFFGENFADQPWSETTGGLSKNPRTPANTQQHRKRDFPIAETYQARLTPARTEHLANRVAHYMSVAPRGAVRIADAAAWMRVPLEHLYSDTFRAQLAERGVETLKVPGVRYVFLYRVADGVPSTDALVAQWTVGVTPYDDAGRDGAMLRSQHHRATTEYVPKIVAFLSKNPGKVYAPKQLMDASGISSRIFQRPKIEALLVAAGVHVRYTPDGRGQKGSRSYTYGETTD